jgi:hypothetical protein
MLMHSFNSAIEIATCSRGSNTGLPYVCRNLQILGSPHMQRRVFAFQYVVLHDTIAILMIAAQARKSSRERQCCPRAPDLLRHNAILISSSVVLVAYHRPLYALNEEERTNLDRDLSSLSLRASVNSFFPRRQDPSQATCILHPFATPSFARFAHYTTSIDSVPAYRLAIDRAAAVYSVCRQWTIRMSTTS